MSSTSITPADRISDHWWSRPGWVPGRLMDMFHLTFTDHVELYETVARLQSAVVGLPLLHLVPRPWLHLTMQVVGWADELRPGVVERVADQAGRDLRALAPFDVELGPALVKGEALVLPARPVAALDELRDRLQTAVALGTGLPVRPPGERAKSYLPHVSIAYASGDASAAPYAAALATVKLPEKVIVRVDNVTLIRQERRLAPDWLYRWDVLDRVRLGP